jgi:putative ABC transport system substrate-binding protein
MPWVAHSPRAQQSERIRRIGVLMHVPEGDREGQDRFGAFVPELRRLGWIDGQNVRLDTRWGASDSDRRRHATELVALAPDVILASTSLAMVALQPATNTVPIVFSNVADPVGAGFVPSLAQPRGNVTGFTLFDYTLSAKWLELLKEIAPRVTRAVVIRDPTSPAAIGQFAVIQSAARSRGMEVTPAGVHDAAEIEHAIKTFLRPDHAASLSREARSASRSVTCSSRLPPDTVCPPFTPSAISSLAAGWSATGRTPPTSTGKLPAMSIASSRGRSRAIFRSRPRPSTTW